MPFVFCMTGKEFGDTGMRTNWIKVIEVYGRKEGFTREEFLAYQCGPHMLAAGKVPEFCGRIRNSYQSTIILPEESAEIASVNNLPDTDCKDSVVEIYFDSADEAYAAFHEPRYLEIVRPDEEYFSDTKNGWSVMVNETILYTGEEESRYLLFLFCKWDNSAAKTWEADRPDLVLLGKTMHAELISENTRIPDKALENGCEYDLILKLAFPSETDLMESVRSRKLHSYLSERDYIDSKSLITYCAVEKRSVPITE